MQTHGTLILNTETEEVELELVSLTEKELETMEKEGRKSFFLFLWSVLLFFLERIVLNRKNNFVKVLNKAMILFLKHTEGIIDVIVGFSLTLSIMSHSST